MKVTKEYEWNEIKWEELDVGDTIRLPEFTVPETTIGGGIELHFEEQTVKDTATVYDIKDDKVYLVFDHALFPSAMDLTGATKWENTQLYRYLSDFFADSMRDSGIHVSDVSLLSKDELFGREALPFFKNGKNRIAFIKDESCIVWCWLKNVVSMSIFYRAYYDSYTDCDAVSTAGAFVRPCFIIKRRAGK